MDDLKNSLWTVIFSPFKRYAIKTTKLCAMKNQISPKDILFFTMLILIAAVGYLGFSQSSSLKLKKDLQTSEVLKKPKIDNKSK